MPSTSSFTRMHPTGSVQRRMEADGRPQPHRRSGLGNCRHSSNRRGPDQLQNYLQVFKNNLESCSGRSSSSPCPLSLRRRLGSTPTPSQSSTLSSTGTSSAPPATSFSTPSTSTPPFAPTPQDLLNRTDWTSKLDVDLRGRLDSQGRRNGKQRRYEGSELEAVEVLDAVCGHVTQYVAYEVRDTRRMLVKDGSKFLSPTQVKSLRRQCDVIVERPPATCPR